MFLGLAAFPDDACAQLIVVPNSAAATEGDGGLYSPFSYPGGYSKRYQQVYDASQFSALNPTGGLITQILFRPDANFGSAFSSTLPSIRIDLSTTTASEGTLSTTFASNVGVDDIIVYGGPTGSPLALSSSFTGPAGGPKAFDIVITLTTPFFYDPALGNLLLDVRNGFGGESTMFDAVTPSGDGVARVYTASNFSNVNTPTADTSDTLGLVTAFTTIAVPAVPEPSTFWGAMLSVGGAILFAFCHRKRSRTA